LSQDRVEVKKIIVLLKKKEFYWKEFRNCEKKWFELFKERCKSSFRVGTLCYKLEEKCKIGNLTQKEIHFCKRKLIDKCPLSSPDDLDELIRIQVNDESTEIAYVQVADRSKKLLLLKTFKAEELEEKPEFRTPGFEVYPSQPVAFWLTSCKLDGERVEILTSFPLAPQKIPLRNYIAKARGKISGDKITDILLEVCILKQVLDSY